MIYLTRIVIILYHFLSSPQSFKFLTTNLNAYSYLVMSFFVEFSLIKQIPRFKKRINLQSTSDKDVS